jgi:transcriptional regulator with XRE-family HTH domain
MKLWNGGDQLMTISEKIFSLLEARGMSQKDFSERTGIAQSTISDWKRKKTDPVSEKILIICEVLNVTPYELLSETEGKGKRGKRPDVIMLDKSSEAGQVMETYLGMDEKMQQRIIGYMKALKELKEK